MMTDVLRMVDTIETNAELSARAAEIEIVRDQKENGDQGYRPSPFKTGGRSIKSKPIKCQRRHHRHKVDRKPGLDDHRRKSELL